MFCEKDILQKKNEEENSVLPLLPAEVLRKKNFKGCILWIRMMMSIASSLSRVSRLQILDHVER